MQLHPTDLENLAIAKRVIANVGNTEDSYRLLMSRLSASDNFETRKRKLKELDHELSTIAGDNGNSEQEVFPENDTGSNGANASLRTPPQTPTKTSKRKRLVVDSSDDDEPSPPKRRQACIDREDSSNSLEVFPPSHETEVTITRLGTCKPVSEHNSIEKLNFKRMTIAMVSPVRNPPNRATCKRNKKDSGERYFEKWDLTEPRNMHISSKQWENYNKVRSQLVDNLFNGNKHIVVGSSPLDFSPEKFLVKTQRRIENWCHTLATDIFKDEKATDLSQCFYPISSFRRIKSYPHEGGWLFSKQIVITSRLYSPIANGNFVDVQYVYIEDLQSKPDSCGRTTTRFLTWVNCSVGYIEHATRPPGEELFASAAGDVEKSWGEMKTGYAETMKLFDWESGENVKGKQDYLADNELEFLEPHLFSHSGCISRLKLMKLLLICAGLGLMEDDNAWETWQHLPYIYQGFPDEEDDNDIFPSTLISKVQGNAGKNNKPSAKKKGRTVNSIRGMTDEEQAAYEEHGIEYGDMVGDEFYKTGMQGWLHGAVVPL